MSKTRFKNQRWSRLLLLFFGCLMGLSNLQAQESVRVSGKVVDPDGNALSGVSISIRGMNLTTSSNQTGDFTIFGPEGQILLFTMIGYNQVERNMEKGGTGNMVVEMSAASVDLEELVVVGYGSVKKENLTGAVSQIKSEALEQRAISTVSHALAGQLAGVQARQPSGRPGRELDIKVRGTHTINASNEPLYIIDGVPGNITDVNHNDVESIEVLKDASSAAIYGARGANGVIIVTTKKGTIGKPTFNFKSLNGFQEVENVVDMMTRDEYVAFNIWGRNESFLRRGGDLSAPMNTRPAADQYPETWLNPESLPDFNWAREVYQVAPMQQYDLSISGGSERVGTHYVSGSYIQDDGILKNTGYTRASLRLKSELNLGSYIKLGMQIAPSYSLESAPNTDGADNIAMLSLVMPRIAPLESQTKQFGFTPGVFSFFNPIARLEQITNDLRSNRLVANLWAEFQLRKDLTFKTLGGYQYINHSGTSFVPSDVTSGLASGSFSGSNNYTYSVQNTLNYRPSIANDLNLDFMIGQSVEGVTSRTTSGSGSGYPFDLVPTLNVAATRSASSADTQNRMASFFGRINADYKDKYLLTINMRQDGSSKFGSQSKWGWFPSASVGWKIDREEFLQDVSWLDLFKLRASVGKVGNNSIGNYESIARLGSTIYEFNGVWVTGLSPNSAGNPLLRWETKESQNYGLDIGLFRNRVQLNVDYYIEDTKDMLLNVPVTHMYGFSSIRQNYGEMRNSGWEFDLTTNNFRGEFKWRTLFNLSRNRNEVQKLGADNAPIIIDTYGYTAFITKVGEPIGSFYMYQSDGVLLEDDFDIDGNPIVPVFAGQEMGNIKIKDMNGDGELNADDLTLLGNNQPDFIWGITNRFEYKNFDFNIFFQGSQGGKLFLLGSRHMDVGQIQGMNQFSRWARSWKTERPADQNPFPEHMDVDLSWDGETPNRFGNNALYNDTWLYDASFIRLRNISLGYNFPKAFGNRIGIKNLRAYVVGDNLYTWTSYKGYSPEAGNTLNGNDTTMPGIDYGSYALPRVYTLGINLTF